MSNTDYWSRYWRKSISRRRVLGTGGALTAGAAGLALVGCGDDDDDDDDGGGGDPTEASNGGGDGDPTEEPSEAAAGPKQGGELVISGGGSATQTLDPHTSLSRAFSYSPYYADRMVSADRQGIDPIHGEVVESWEQVDDNTLTLTVRPGITFHEGKITEGRALVAEDVAFNLMRIAGKLDPERSAQFQRSSTLGGMDEAVAVDETTVQVTFDIPNSVFLYGMADGRNWMVARENVEADPNFTDFGAQAGTGPFIVDSWDDAQGIGTYVRNPNYWKEGFPYLDSVKQVNLPDTASRRSAFTTGQIDFIDAQSPEEREAYEGEGVNIHGWEDQAWDYFRMNQTRAPFDDPRVRKAMHLALDKPQMNNSNFGEGFWDYSGPLVSGFPGTWTASEVSQMAGWNPDTREADVAEAKLLIDEALGGGSNLKFTLLSLGLEGHALTNGPIFVQDQLRQIWPDADIGITGEAATFGRSLGAADYDATVYSSTPPPSAVLEAGLHYRTDGGRNYTGFSEPEIDSLIDSAQAAFDADERAEILGQLQELLLDRMYISTFGKAQGVFAYQVKVKNFDTWVGPGMGYKGFAIPISAHQLWLDT